MIVSPSPPPQKEGGGATEGIDEAKRIPESLKVGLVPALVLGGCSIAIRVRPPPADAVRAIQIHYRDSAIQNLFTLARSRRTSELEQPRMLSKLVHDWKRDNLRPEGNGPVAQRLEQGTHNPLVPGSNPGGPRFFQRSAAPFSPQLGVEAAFRFGNDMTMPRLTIRLLHKSSSRSVF